VDLEAYNEKDASGMAQMTLGGVYEIVNILNGQRYIGSSIDIKSRINCHKSSLNGGYSHCKHLQRAWNKYGEKNFVFSILLKCEEGKVLSWEQFFIDNCVHHYNILKHIDNGTAMEKLRLKKEKQRREKRDGIRKAKEALDARDTEIFAGLFL